MTVESDIQLADVPIQLGPIHYQCNNHHAFYLTSLALFVKNAAPSFEGYCKLACALYK